MTAAPGPQQPDEVRVPSVAQARRATLRAEQSVRKALWMLYDIVEVEDAAWVDPGDDGPDPLDTRGPAYAASCDLESAIAHVKYALGKFDGAR